jgi:hypothetical protein
MSSLDTRSRIYHGELVTAAELSGLRWGSDPASQCSFVVAHRDAALQDMDFVDEAGIWVSSRVSTGADHRAIENEKTLTRERSSRVTPVHR